MTNICRLGPDGKYAGNINKKYVVLANILYSTVACTCISIQIQYETKIPIVQETINFILCRFVCTETLKRKVGCNV